MARKRKRIAYGNGNLELRRRVWWARWSHDGIAHAEKTGAQDRDAAQAFLAARIATVRGGAPCPVCAVKAAAPAGPLTVDAVCDGLLAYHGRKGLHSTASARSQLEAWRALYGDRLARQLTAADLDAAVARWQEDGRVTPATINRRLQLLRRAFVLAKLPLELAGLDSEDRYLTERSPRGKYIAPAELASILAHLPAGLAALTELAYRTGKRLRQLACMRWTAYDPATATLTWQATETKGAVVETLPLSGRALALVEALDATRPLHCPYAFHGARCAPMHRPSQANGCVGDFRKAWGTACRAAGLPVGRKHGGVVFHNTRNSAVRNLSNAGVSFADAAAITGHRTRSAFDRYGLATCTRTALATVDAFLDGQPSTPVVVPLRPPA